MAAICVMKIRKFITRDNMVFSQQVLFMFIWLLARGCMIICHYFATNLSCH